eukprot:5514869-Amphidinium_carterae.1
MLKKITMLSGVGDTLNVEDDVFLKHIGEPSLPQLMDYRILTTLPKLCSSLNAQLSVALSCTSISSLWSSSWLPTLNRFKLNCTLLAELPVACPGNFEVWFRRMTTDVASWSTMARRCFLSRKPHQDLHKCYKVTTSELLGHMVLLAQGYFEHEAFDQDVEALPPDEFVHTCPVCSKTFATNRGLCTHKMRAHDLIPLSLRVKGTSCISCGSQLGTRVRLLNHLQDKISCGLYAIANVEPMSLSEYKSSVTSLNAQNDLLARELPKTGPNTSHGMRLRQPTSCCPQPLQ